MANREARRHGPQLKPKPGGGARKPPSVRSGLTGGGGGNKTPALAGGMGRRSLAQAGWLQGIWSEIKKVQWPSRSEAWNLTLVVLLVSVSLGVALGGIDTIFGWFMQNTVLK